jgi:hypothetical protein
MRLIALGYVPTGIAGSFWLISCLVAGPPPAWRQGRTTTYLVFRLNVSAPTWVNSGQAISVSAAATSLIFAENPPLSLRINQIPLSYTDSKVLGQHQPLSKLRVRARRTIS